MDQGVSSIADDAAKRAILYGSSFRRGGEGRQGFQISRATSSTTTPAPAPPRMRLRFGLGLAGTLGPETDGDVGLAGLALFASVAGDAGAGAGAGDLDVEGFADEVGGFADEDAGDAAGRLGAWPDEAGPGDGDGVPPVPPVAPAEVEEGLIMV